MNGEDSTLTAQSSPLVLSRFFLPQQETTCLKSSTWPQQVCFDFRRVRSFFSQQTCHCASRTPSGTSGQNPHVTYKILTVLGKRQWFYEITHGTHNFFLIKSPQLLLVLPCSFYFCWTSFITENSHVSHRGVTESAQTFLTPSKCISITWFALYRCFQFSSLCRARFQKRTSVLLLPGCCSQNTSDSRANVVTGDYKPKSPKPVCNHVSVEHYSTHVLAFMHDALHDKQLV